MALAGSLSEVALGDLIQFYCSSRQTVRLAVSYRDGEALIFVDEGELVHAAFGRHRGIAAVYAAMAHAAEGTFQVENNVRQGERTITDSWKVVCLELASMVEEARRETPSPGTEEKVIDRAATPAPQAADALPARPAGGATGEPMPSTTKVCPICRKVLPDGETCPDHQGGFAARPRPTAGPAPAPRPSGSAAPPPAPAPRPPVSTSPPRTSRISPAVWLGIGGAALALAAALYFALRPSAAPPPAPPKAAAPPPVTLGMSTALTGPSKELGRQMKLGVETALGVVNDAGGIEGRKFNLVALDDGYEPARTKDAMRELVENKKAFAIVGNVGTPTAEVSVPYVLEKKILFFGPFTGAGLLRREPPDRYVFNYRASYVEETAAVVRYLVEVRKVKPTQIAVFAQQDGYGDAGFGGVVRALRRYGRDQDQILRVGYKRNTLDIAEAVDTIVKNQKQIRAIVMVPTYRPAARMIEKVRDLGLDVIFTNVSFVGSSALAEELHQLGPKYCSGVIVTQVVPPTDSSATAIIKYREALQHYFPGEAPDFVSLEGYITTNILMEGFRRAGKNVSTDSLIDGLEGIHNLEMGIGTLINYGPSEHQGSHKVWGTVLNDACRFQLLDLE
jgi:branched-chain amino acid transport system substrate-binding protein